MKNKWGCQSKQARSIVICNALEDTRIGFYAGPGRMSSGEPHVFFDVKSNMHGCITIPTFEMPHKSDLFLGDKHVVQVVGKYSEFLDGNVSSFVIRTPSCRKVYVEDCYECRFCY